MTTEELIEKLELIQKLKCETSTLELKSAEQGCPKHLYDSLSSFSNQDDGGIIIFGVDEKQNYKEVGVYDPQDIQKKINEQCLQMEPIVRPLLTVAEMLSAEISFSSTSKFSTRALFNASRSSRSRERVLMIT